MAGPHHSNMVKLFRNIPLLFVFIIIYIYYQKAKHTFDGGHTNIQFVQVTLGNASTRFSLERYLGCTTFNETSTRGSVIRVA